ncbi:MAG: hypothetical protein E7642_07495 [Ruminococcaceae bacterium]|nr:hypothetical protein [Oscillospiraceae bacterium]
MKKRIIFASILFITLIITCTTAVFMLLAHHDRFCPHSELREEIIVPTCTSVGKTLHVCLDCGETYETEITPPREHSLKGISIKPLCNAEGYTLNYCECGYSFRSDTVAPVPHEFSKSVTAPTCEDQGYTKYTCSICGYSYQCEYVSPLGHSFSSSTVLPTATSAGYTHYVCPCSYEYKGNYVYYSDILEDAYTDNTDVLARGIDVSRWNHQIDAASGEYLPIDWQAVRAAGKDFVILKAGSTKSGIEPTFEMDYAGARAAGLEIGVYFYTYSTTVAGIAKDAEMLMLWLEGKQFEYPIYLDLEDSSLASLGKNHLSLMCETFLCKLQENGYYAGLYTNHTWLTTILDTPRIVTLFDLWYARYPGTSVPTWNEEKYGKQLGMWQYSESGSIAGIDGDFDMNYAYKHYGELMKKWGLNGF